MTIPEIEDALKNQRLNHQKRKSLRGSWYHKVLGYKPPRWKRTKGPAEVPLIWQLFWRV